MKQAVTLTPAQREALYLELAPSDIEAVPVIMPEQYPTPAPVSGALTREQLTVKIQQEYIRQQATELRKQTERSQAAGRLALVQLSAIGAGCTLAYQIAVNFNPVAFAVTFGVVGLVGLLTYPRKAKEEQPTWMPREGGQPVKTQIANVNPVVNVTVNMMQ